MANVRPRACYGEQIWVIRLILKWASAFRSNEVQFPLIEAGEITSGTGNRVNDETTLGSALYRFF